MSDSTTSRSLTVVAKALQCLRVVTEFVREGAHQANFSQERIDELELLVDELIMNVCNHAYPHDEPGEITVTYSIPAPGELSVEIADQGYAFNPLEAEAPDLTLSLDERPIGGLGIHLLKVFAETLTYRREQGWNRLTFGLSARS